MRKIRDVLRLAAQEISHRKIALSLQIGRTTIRDYILRARLAGLSWPLPDELGDKQLEDLLFPPQDTASEQPLPDWKAIRTELVRPGVTLALLWEEYRTEHKNGYGYSQFCNLYRIWRGQLARSMRQSHVAGEKLFVDYSGQLVRIIDPVSGELREAELFVATLGASDYTFAEATWTQKMSDWTGSHVRALEYFGGVPALVVPDNLKSAVIRACFHEPEVNRSYADLARHYDTAILPARPYKPKDKAKAEVAVQIAQRWILASLRNRTFSSLAEVNTAIRILLDKLNNKVTRHLGASRKELFEDLDKPALKPLPADPYVYARWKQCSIGLDYHIRIDGHFYSVPHRHVRDKLWVRITARTIEAFCKGKRVACHMRSDKAREKTTLEEHMPPAHRHYAEWTPEKLLAKAEGIGPDTAILTDVIMRDKPHPEQGLRAGAGIIKLARAFGEDRLEAACTRAIAIGARTYSSVKSILENNLDRQKPQKSTDDPAITHDNIRGRHYYH
jgi:transposase